MAEWYPQSEKNSNTASKMPYGLSASLQAPTPVESPAVGDTMKLKLSPWGGVMLIHPEEIPMKGDRIIEVEVKSVKSVRIDVVLE